jgi:uncharacterized protein (DUF305 family)
MEHMHWRKLLLMSVLSFLAMYVLMYVMVDRYENVYSNVNQIYMAGVMTGAMVILEVFIMREMYSRKVQQMSVLLGVIVLVACFLFVRRQTAVGDEQFLRSMIPHHAAAILMCNEAEVVDPEIKDLCKNITSGQQSEIDFMKAKLNSFK